MLWVVVTIFAVLIVGFLIWRLLKKSPRDDDRKRQSEHDPGTITLRINPAAKPTRGVFHTRSYTIRRGRHSSRITRSRIARITGQTWRKPRIPYSDYESDGWLEYPEDWGEITASIRQRDSRRCQRCGATGVELHVHHIEGRSDDPDNLITLCRECHAELHPHMQ